MASIIINWPGLVKLNDPAGELSSNYATQKKKNMYVDVDVPVAVAVVVVVFAIGAAKSQIWDAISKVKRRE